MPHLVANSEHQVKEKIRQLRCAIAYRGKYQPVMKLKLKELRTKLGWSQEHVASLVGMSKSFYSEIESGKKAANSHRLRKFAEVFQVSAFELIDDSTLDSVLLDHLRTMQALDGDDRDAVIRHALALLASAEPPE